MQLLLSKQNHRDKVCGLTPPGFHEEPLYTMLGKQVDWFADLWILVVCHTCVHHTGLSQMRM